MGAFRSQILCFVLLWLIAWGYAPGQAQDLSRNASKIIDSNWNWICSCCLHQDGVGMSHLTLSRIQSLVGEQLTDKINIRAIMQASCCCRRTETKPASQLLSSNIDEKLKRTWKSSPQALTFALGLGTKS